MNLRNDARRFIKFDVGDGKNFFFFFFWHDNWHPAGVLFQKYGFRVIYDAASKFEAKVEIVLHNKVWVWRPARSEELVDMQSNLSLVERKEEDKAIWTATKLGCYLVLLHVKISEPRLIQCSVGSYYCFNLLSLDMHSLAVWS